MTCVDPRRSTSFVLFHSLLFGVLVISAAVAEPPVVGPTTERRFPPLNLPEGFRATLFACDPLVEYPSVIARGPAAGTLFVAHDYMTGLGTEIVRRDEVRLLRDTDGDGYADRSTVYADGFNSIQGLACHAGTVYVMHAPRLTSLTDTDGDGAADQRRDLLVGLGLPPEENPNRLHCANGVVAGHDGWLYLAIGDRGCDVKRPEGDRLVLREGGILRCRPDGRDLHVFSHGLRNIYDVALDEELNVFVRDNENDGGDYMIRVCHCFHGSDHGYPYLYYERPEGAMPPLADLGRGSSAGGVAYLEAAFPPEYRESLFFCEWGRAVVRYRKQRSGSSFEEMREVDFASGAADDPYGFKPTDLVVDRDGSLLISDWGDGQRPKRGRGRIYRITYGEAGAQQRDPVDISPRTKVTALWRSLNADRYTERVAAQLAIEQRGKAGAQAVQQAMEEDQINPLGRLHAIGILTHVAGREAIDDLFHLAKTDADARVRAQCVRAVADLTDPVFRAHRLDAGRGDEKICRRLVQLADNDADPRVRLEVLIALGRLHWSGAPAWLQDNWSNPDPALAHAAMVLLRRANNPSAVLRLLDVKNASVAVTPSLRTLALRALAEQADATVVDGLLSRLEREPEPVRRREYIDLLARVYKKPGAWTYWGFRPAPRPADSVAWECSEKIAAALDGALGDVDSSVRAFAARRMLREDVPIKNETLNEWLRHEKNPDAVAAILKSLAARPPAEVRDRLETVIRSSSHTDENRISALTTMVRGLDDETEGRLLDIAESLDDGVVLAAVIDQLAARPGIPATSLFLAHLDSPNDDVRAAASEALAKRPVDAAAPRVKRLLQDDDIRVRRAAAALAGKLKVRDAVELLLEAAGHADPALRAAALRSLAELRVPAALPLAVKACDSPETQAAALRCLAAVGGPQNLDTVVAVGEKSRSIEVLAESAAALLSWQDRFPRGSDKWLELERAVATIQSASGLPLVWRVHRPASAAAAQSMIEQVADPMRSAAKVMDEPDWRTQLAATTDAHMRLEAAEEAADESTWLAVSDFLVDQPQDVELLASADGSLRVWLNGRRLIEREKPGRFQDAAESIETAMDKGLNRLLVEIRHRGSPRFQLRLRRKSSKAEHERLTRLALTGRGNANRGRELFLNAERSQCIKCHRLGEEGGRIGPDLAGIGRRFARIHLVESILEPSRTVAPSYESIVVALNSGRILTGVRISETEDLLTLGDNEGKVYEIDKSQVAAVKVQPTSVMPEGLEKRLTDREFVDLISFLVSQRKTASN